MNAIFAMGLLGAGTNNARLAQMLRQLASYYHKEPNGLFMVRIAQGLVHMGKGTVSINPFHSNRFLMSPVAMAGLMSTVVAFVDTNNSMIECGSSSSYLTPPPPLASLPPTSHPRQVALCFVLPSRRCISSFLDYVGCGPQEPSSDGSCWTSRGHCRPSWSSQDDHRIPNTLNARAPGPFGACRARHRGVYDHLRGFPIFF